MQGFTEPDTDGAGAAGQNDPRLRIEPTGCLRPPAIDRILEVADDRERERGQARRQPVEHPECVTGKRTEGGERVAAPGAPALAEHGRQTIENGATGPRQQRAQRTRHQAAEHGREEHEPGDHAEHVPVRPHQPLFDRDLGNLGLRELVRRILSPGG